MNWSYEWPQVQEMITEHTKELVAENERLAARVAEKDAQIKELNAALAPLDAIVHELEIEDDHIDPVEFIRSMLDVVKAARELRPHTDKLVCFVSTTKEYPLNGIVKRFNEALDRLDGKE